MVRVETGHIGMPERAGRRQHDERRIGQRDRHSRQDQLLIESETRHDRVTRTFIYRSCPPGPEHRYGLALSFCLMHSTSSVISTSSPTAKPPLSRTLFHTMPKSLRFSLPVAENPARVMP